MEPEAGRWKIKVSKQTDLTLRSYLGARGAKKGDLAKFIEEAVRWRVFDQKVQEIGERNAGTDPVAVQKVIDGAVAEARSERSAKKKAKWAKCVSFSTRTF